MTRKKTYEVMLLLDNREVKKGWDVLKEQIDGVLTKHGGKVVVAKRWDERKLAYEIKKQRRATYYLSYLEAEPAILDDLERSLRLTAPVLRHLVLACEEIPGEAYEAEREFDLDKPDEEKVEMTSDAETSTDEAKSEVKSEDAAASEETEEKSSIDEAKSEEAPASEETPEESPTEEPESEKE